MPGGMFLVMVGNGTPKAIFAIMEQPHTTQATRVSYWSTKLQPIFQKTFMCTASIFLRWSGFDGAGNQKMGNLPGTPSVYEADIGKTLMTQGTMMTGAHVEQDVYDEVMTIQTNVYQIILGVGTVLHDRG